MADESTAESWPSDRLLFHDKEHAEAAYRAVFGRAIAAVARLEQEALQRGENDYAAWLRDHHRPTLLRGEEALLADILSAARLGHVEPESLPPDAQIVDVQLILTRGGDEVEKAFRETLPREFATWKASQAATDRPPPTEVGNTADASLERGGILDPTSLAAKARNDDHLRELGELYLRELTTSRTGEVEVDPPEVKELREWLGINKVKGKFPPWWHQKVAKAGLRRLVVPPEVYLLCDLLDRAFPGTSHSFNPMAFATRPHLTEPAIVAYLREEHGMTQEQAENLSILDLADTLSRDVREREAGLSGEAPEATHSEDYRSANWFGTCYEFTPNQAACVQQLWEHWERGGLAVGAPKLLEAADCESERIDVVFRDCAAWGTMIVPGQTKGTYRLTKPTANPPPKPVTKPAKKKTRRT